MKTTIKGLRKVIRETVSADLLAALIAWAGQDPEQMLRVEAPYTDQDEGTTHPAAVVDPYHMVAAYVDDEGKLMVNTPDGFTEMTVDEMFATMPLE